MENKKGGGPLSRFFNSRAGKGATIGGGIMLGIGIFTSAPVSIPLIAGGAVVGAVINEIRGQNKPPRP